MISSIICCFTLLLIFLIPESPSWLLSRGQSEEAHMALSRIRGVKDNSNNNQSLRGENLKFKICFSHIGSHKDLITSEIEQMQNRILSSRSQSSQRPSVWKLLRAPQVLKPLLIINAFFAFQQLTGTFVIVVCKLSYLVL